MLIKCLHPGECGKLADLLEDLPLPGAQGERGRHSQGSCFSRPDGSSAENLIRIQQPMNNQHFFNFYFILSDS
jgi:hypothetical protein